MKKRKIAAAITALLLMLSLTSCATIIVEIPVSFLPAYSNNTQPQTTAAPETQYIPPATEAEQNPDSGSTTADESQNMPETTEAPAAEQVTVPKEQTAEPATEKEQTGLPEGKEAIVEYYVNAYNRIGTESSSVNRVYDYTSNYNNILEINNNATFEKMAKMLMDKFMQEDFSVKSGDVSLLPPVGVAALSISPDKISDASVKDMGDTLEITLKSTGTDDNYEIDTEPGQGSVGLIGPLLRTNDVTGAAGSFVKFEGLHAWYATASVTATVDKATGRITQLKYITPCVLHFDKATVAFISLPNCNIGLLFQQTWEVGY